MMILLTVSAYVGQFRVVSIIIYGEVFHRLPERSAQFVNFSLSVWTLNVNIIACASQFCTLYYDIVVVSTAITNGDMQVGKR